MFWFSFHDTTVVVVVFILFLLFVPCSCQLSDNKQTPAPIRKKTIMYILKLRTQASKITAMIIAQCSNSPTAPAACWIAFGSAIFCSILLNFALRDLAMSIDASAFLLAISAVEILSCRHIMSPSTFDILSSMLILWKILNSTGEKVTTLVLSSVLLLLLLLLTVATASRNVSSRLLLPSSSQPKVDYSVVGKPNSNKNVRDHFVLQSVIKRTRKKYNSHFIMKNLLRIMATLAQWLTPCLCVQLRLVRSLEVSS